MKKTVLRKLQELGLSNVLIAAVTDVSSDVLSRNSKLKIELSGSESKVYLGEMLLFLLEKDSEYIYDVKFMLEKTNPQATRERIIKDFHTY